MSCADVTYSWSASTIVAAVGDTITVGVNVATANALLTARVGIAADPHLVVVDGGVGDAAAQAGPYVILNTFTGPTDYIGLIYPSSGSAEPWSGEAFKIRVAVVSAGVGVLGFAGAAPGTCLQQTASESNGCACISCGDGTGNCATVSDTRLKVLAHRID